MTTNVIVETAGGSDIHEFIETVLFGLNLSDKDTVEFGDTFIAITGPDGNKFNLKGTFNYKGTETEHANFLGGTVTSITLVENPGYFHYARFTAISLDANAVLAAITSGALENFFALLGALKFVGNDGADAMIGSLLDDTISGGEGADDIAANDGNDLVEGGAGGDILSGGLGNDTLSYKNSSARVVVNLTGGADGGDATGDRIAGFENIIGSDFSDELIGSNGANILEGGQGNDKLQGGLGADLLDGGGGNDTADYSNSKGSITINLGTGLAAGGHADGDVLDQIENVNGSAGKDVLTGNDLANVLMGNAGEDILDGGLNADRLIGGSGADRLIGGQGLDTLQGRGGADTYVLFNLSASADTILDFEVGKDHLEINAALFGGDLISGLDLTAAQVEVNRTGLASTKEAVFIFNERTGELFYDVNGSGGGTIGSRLVATLDGVLTGFSHDDFSIV
jgi:Ca2+-binding RTX toxin-like protein